MGEKMSTEDLINKTKLKRAAFARAADISYSQLLRCLHGERISKAYAQRIVDVLNEKLKPETPYTINDLNFNLSDF